MVAARYERYGEMEPENTSEDRVLYERLRKRTLSVCIPNVVEVEVLLPSFQSACCGTENKKPYRLARQERIEASISKNKGDKVSTLDEIYFTEFNTFVEECYTSVGNTPTSVGNAPTSVGKPPTSVGNTPTSVGNTPTSVGNAPTSEGNTPTSEGNAPTSEGNTPTSEDIYSVYKILYIPHTVG